MVSAARKIRIVTECSGLEPLPYVFERLGLAGRYEMAAACEIDPICRRVIRLCHTGSARPKKLFKDISIRPPQELPDHDFYVAGFPCQPFSTMGVGQGMRDARGRGLIINHIISALATKRPRAFLLENVKGLVTQHNATFNKFFFFAAIAPHGRVRLQSWIQNHRHGRLWHPTASRARLHRGFAPGRHGPWVLIHLAYPAASHTAGHSARLAENQTNSRRASGNNDF
jgi:site-specific DNA-cytosine methylase